MSTKRKPCTLTVTLGKGEPEVHALKDDKDWAIISDNTLEVRTDSINYYYPLDGVRKWKVEYGEPVLTISH